jgi:hypothetical protein
MPEWLQFKHRVRVYVPSTRDMTTVISGEEFASRVQEVSKQLAEWYGGATELPPGARGVYQTQAGDMVREDVQQVEGLCTNVEVGQLLTKVEQWREAWGQESVLVEVDNTGYLVGITA